MSENGNHWLNIIEVIFDSSSINLIDLAEIAGSSPRNFYRGVNLSGADLRGQDLRGIDFNGSDLSNVLVDKRTRLDSNVIDRVMEPTISGMSFTIPIAGNNIVSQLRNAVVLPSPLIDAAIDEGSEFLLQDQGEEAMLIMSNFICRSREADKVIVLGNAIESINKLDVSIFYSNSIGLFPKNASILRKMINFLNSRKRYNESLKYLGDLIREFPENIEASVLLGETLFRLGEVDEALRHLRDLIQRMPIRGAVWSQLINLFIRRGRPESALEIAAEAHRAHPESLAIFKLFLRASQAADLWGQAEQEIPRVVASGGQMVGELVRFASLRTTSAKLRDVIVNGHLWRVDHRLYLVGVREALGKDHFTEAEALAVEWCNVAEVGAEWVRARRELAEIKYNMGDFGEYIGILNDLINIDSEEVSRFKWLADANMRIGRPSEAIRLLKSAHDKFSFDTAPIIWLAEAQYSTGDLEGARVSVSQIVARGRGESRRVKKLLNSLVEMPEKA